MSFPKHLPKTAALIRRGMDEGFHPGAQLYVSLRGEAVADEAFGFARPGVPMQPDTLLIWMSAGKPLGAVALAQLWEQGKLDLDAPVAQVIPEFAAGGKNAITPRHLLTHCGGFRLAYGLQKELPWDEAVAKACAARLEPGWIVGETVGYHAETSWYIVGELVRRLDGRPYEQYIREAIALPLGMNDMWAAMPPSAFHACGDRIGWTSITDPPNAIDPPPNGWETEAMASRCIPGAGVRGPARDLARFYEALLGNGAPSGSSGDFQLLKPATVAAFTAIHRRGVFDKTFRHKLNWGTGFMVNSNEFGTETVPYGFGRHASPSTFGHGGRESSAGFADPKNQLAVAAIFNGMPGEARHQARIRDAFSAIYEDLGLIA